MSTIVAAMGCVINQKGEILLALRNDPKSPKVHHKWQLPGGAVEAGETLENAVIREVKEETGLDVVITSNRPAVTFGNSNVLLIGYKCKAVGGELGKNIVSETAKLQWFNIKEIPWEVVLSGNREVINQLMEE